jgi:hypothetical protein
MSCPTIPGEAGLAALSTHVRMQLTGPSWQHTVMSASKSVTQAAGTIYYQDGRKQALIS